MLRVGVWDPHVRVAGTKSIPLDLVNTKPPNDYRVTESQLSLASKDPDSKPDLHSSTHSDGKLCDTTIKN